MCALLFFQLPLPFTPAPVNSPPSPLRFPSYTSPDILVVVTEETFVERTLDFRCGLTGLSMGTFTSYAALEYAFIFVLL